MKKQIIKTLKNVEYEEHDNIRQEPIATMYDEEGDIIPLNRGELKQFTLKCHLFGKNIGYYKENEIKEKKSNIEVRGKKIDVVSADANVIVHYNGTGIKKELEDYVNSLIATEYCYISSVNIIKKEYIIYWFDNKNEYLKFLIENTRIDKNKGKERIRLNDYRRTEKNLQLYW